MVVGVKSSREPCWVLQINGYERCTVRDIDKDLLQTETIQSWVMEGPFEYISRKMVPCLDKRNFLRSDTDES